MNHSDPIVAASIAPRLDGEEPLPALKFPDRPRPFAEQIALLDKAHGALVGHLECGEKRRAIDAIQTHMRKLSSAMESLGAFAPEIDMGGVWHDHVIRDYFDTRRSWMLQHARCIAIKVTNCLESAGPEVKGSFSIERGLGFADYAYTAGLVDWRWIRTGEGADGKPIFIAVAIYEIEVLPD